MKAISLFSGAGGFEIGFDRAGIETVLQAERDPWCLEILKHHWLEVERVEDVRQVNARTLSHRGGYVAGAAVGSDAKQFRPQRRDEVNRTVDLVYGGFPCQDVSVAGNRAGLSGERSGLWHEFHRVLRELRPRWCVVENVPGLLSSDSGRDLQTILCGLDELGYGVAWRVLDARYFGVPQRRRRVFFVGCLGDPIRAAQVLAVCAGCSGHSAPRGQSREDIAPTLDDGARRASVELPMIAATLSGGGHASEVNLPGRHHEDDENLVVARSLAAENGHRNDPTEQNFIIGSLQARDFKGAGNQYVEEGKLIVANGLRASDGHHGHSSPRGDGADNLIAFSNRGNDTGGAERLRAASHGAIPMVAGTVRSHVRPGSNDVGGVVGVLGVRRLTPLECERLMGWPDDWTRYTSDGREIPDSHRYRMCGNGVVSTVAEWIGHRLMKADQL